MEDVLYQYARPHNPRRPVVCVDERPCFLVGDVITPLPLSAGHPRREDYHSSKHGSRALLTLTGQRWAQVYAQRTPARYTDFMAFLSQQFLQAQEIVPDQDDLHAHLPGSFAAHRPPQDAFDLAQRFNRHHTPVGASWLNMIELEFAVLTRQCLDRRIPDQHLLSQEGAA